MKTITREAAFDKTNDVLNEILEERIRQNQKWGEQNKTPVEWIAILTEETGEAAREAVDFYFRYGLINPVKKQTRLEANIQIERLQKYRKECIQVAAVAVQMIECLDRQFPGVKKINL